MQFYVHLFCADNKNMKKSTLLKKITATTVLILSITSCTTTKTNDSNSISQSKILKAEEDEVFEFTELWGYVMNERESAWNNELPLTDICYFTPAITTFSEVPTSPPKEKFFSQTEARVHLVTSCDSKAQTHLLLSPKLPLRDKIIDDLVKASETYDGLQIDWELVSAVDDENFLEFLSLLRSKLGNKILSVAVPARMRTLQKDAYSYAKIAPLVDKVIIMAYDQHWSTSEPGPIAGTLWCQKITEYAKTQIPEEKLIMGLSFYGRAWRDDKLGGKAYIYSTLEEIISEHEIKHFTRDEYDTPSFKITKKLTVTTWFDDEKSLATRTKMYRDSGINALSFWRVGQEDKRFWNYLKIKEPAE